MACPKILTRKKEVSEAHPEVIVPLKKMIEVWHAATKKTGIESVGSCLGL